MNPLVMAGVIALKGATVYPVSSAPIENATVLVIGNQVVQVGANVSIPASAHQIDVAGKVITPGLMHAASALGLIEVAAEPSANDMDQTPWQGSRRYLRAAYSVRDAFNPRSSLIPIARASGITSAVVIPSGALVSGYGSLVTLSGASADASVQRSNLAVYATLAWPEREGVGGRTGAWQLLRQFLDDARFYSDHKGRFDQNGTRNLIADRVDLDAMDGVVRGRTPFVLRVDRASDIQSALRLARDYRLRLVLLSAAEGWLVASEIAAAKVPVLVSLPENNPTSFDQISARSDNPARLAAAGVMLGIVNQGTHNAARLRQEAANAIVDGLPRDAALKAITVNPARMLGVTDGTGTLAAGAPATLVVWSGDPFALSSRVERVFIEGQEVGIETRQTLLLKRYRTLRVAQ